MKSLIILLLAYMLTTANAQTAYGSISEFIDINF